METIWNRKRELFCLLGILLGDKDRFCSPLASVSFGKSVYLFAVNYSLISSNLSLGTCLARSFQQKNVGFQKCKGGEEGDKL